MKNKTNIEGNTSLISFSNMSCTYKRHSSYVPTFGKVSFSSVNDRQRSSKIKKAKLKTSWKAFCSLSNCQDGVFAMYCIGAVTGVYGVGVSRKTAAVNLDNCTATCEYVQYLYLDCANSNPS